MVNRSAFTLIELIFAIVVIAISVLSLPTMNQSVSKGIESNIVQEAIFAASTELNQAVTYFWDESSIEGSNSFARIIWDNSSDCNRSGLIFQEKHRRCRDDNTSATHYNEGDDDDLDDAAHGSSALYIGGSTGTSTGYKKAYNSEIQVSGDASFGETNNNPNVKKISVEIKDSDGNLITKLDTYSSNIGEVDYFKRTY